MKTQAPYVTTVALAAALAMIFLVPVGCGPREEAAPAPSSAEPMASTAPAAEPSAPAAEPSSPQAEPSSPQAEPSSPQAEPSTPTAEPSSPENASAMPATEPQQAKPSPVPAAPPASTSESPATKPVPEPPAATPPASTAPPSAPPPSPPASAPRPADSQPAPSADGVVDPGGEIAVEPTRPGLTRVGAAKCGVCHKIQYASWSETAHAKRTPPLDCESCHGPGSEYKSLSVMKDPEKAKAAGLVLPTATFCKTCHRQGWSDDLLQKAHARKNPPKS